MSLEERVAVLESQMTDIRDDIKSIKVDVKSISSSMQTLDVKFAKEIAGNSSRVLIQHLSKRDRVLVYVTFISALIAAISTIVAHII